MKIAEAIKENPDAAFFFGFIRLTCRVRIGLLMKNPSEIVSVLFYLPILFLSVASGRGP
jgi:hypothetical protein